MNGWRTALRIAWREARRAKVRAALVIGMILLPVAALAFTAVSYDSFTLTPHERAERTMGTAQAVVRWLYDNPVIQEPDQTFALPLGQATRDADPTEDRLRALLPPGTTLLPNDTGSLVVNTIAGTGSVRTRQVDYLHPLAQGVLRQLSGRAPATDDQVALTPKAVERTGADIGGMVRTIDGRALRVVGVVEDPDDLKEAKIVLRPGALPVDRGDRAWLVTSPLTWAQVKELNTHGVTALSRQVLVNLPPQSERYPLLGPAEQVEAGVLALIAGLAMLEIVLLAGPALAVGARRRRRDLALVAATGGSPAHVRRIVLADGVVLGTLAALTGVAIGTAVAVAAIPLVERFTGTRAGALRLYPSALALLAVLAVVTGVLAALVPAWISSRQPVVAGLAGRRGITRSRRRWLVLGLLLVAAGSAVVVYGAWHTELTIVLAGLAVAEIGLVLCTPSLVGLVARTGRWLPVAVRIALRDTSRNRTAAAPAISAVMAVVIGSLAVSLVLNSQMAGEANQTAGNFGDVDVFRAVEGSPVGEPFPSNIAEAVRSMLPVTDVHEIRLLSCDNGPCFARARLPAALECPYRPDLLGRTPTEDEQRSARADSRCDGFGTEFRYFNALTTPSGVAVVIAPEAARAVAGLPDGDVGPVSEALRAGKIVVPEPRYLDNGMALIGIGLNKGESPRTVTGPGFALPHKPRAPFTMMTEDTARSLGFGSAVFTLHATTSRMPTVDEQDRLQGVLGAEWEVRVARATETGVQHALTLLAVVAAVITLGAAALATGLAAADGKADLTTLAAVGASPRLRRALSLSQSGVIAGLGSVLGVAAGLGTSIAVLTALNQRYAGQWPVPPLYPITVPWVNVGVALVVVPLVAMLGAGLLARSRLPIERRE